jgi:subtilisin
VRRRCLLLLCLLALPGLLPPRPPAAQAQAAPGRYLVSTDPAAGSAAAQAATHADRLGVRPERVFSSALEGYSATVPAGALAALRAQPGVRSVVPDRPVELASQTVSTGVARIGGGELVGDGGDRDAAAPVDADVAVLDTGIDLRHPELLVAGGSDCTQGGEGGEGGYGDANGHGTHVAGTVAAADDGDGVVGVAPGARLWAVRVLDGQGRGTLASVLCGIDWVTARADVIEVANLSLGTPGERPSRLNGCATGDPLHDAICRSVAAGVTYTVAAGNQAADAGASVPAAYDEVLTVSALADFDGRPGGRGGPG